jgi:acyl-CoA thioester hydrolase
MLEEFRKVSHFRVPFADIDMLQHANNTAYLRWAETARSEYLIEVIGADIGGRTGMILARLDISYERAISYRENIAIGCRVSRLGNKSFDFAHEVWSVDSETRCAKIVTTMVAMDYGRETSIAVPAEWRKRIAAYELVGANA